MKPEPPNTVTSFGVSRISVMATAPVAPCVARLRARLTVRFVQSAKVPQSAAGQEKASAGFRTPGRAWRRPKWRLPPQDSEVEEDRRPRGSTFPSRNNPGPADPVEIDGDQQHEHGGEGSRPRQEADGDQYAAEELGQRQKQRPEGAGMKPSPSTMPAAPSRSPILPAPCVTRARPAMTRSSVSAPSAAML